VRHFDDQVLLDLETLWPFSCALASLGTLQPRAIRSLYPLEPFISVSNYYLDSVPDTLLIVYY